GRLWYFYFGLAVVGLTNLFGFIIVASGQFRCMMGAAERFGARWFMFACLACLFISPTINIAASVAGAQPPLDIHNPKSFTHIQYTQMGENLRLLGFALGLLYPLSFLLFLRSVACCMHSRGHVIALNVFLLIAMVLVAMTGYFLYDARWLLRQGMT